MTSRRQERVAEALLEELGLLISSELIDPRLEDAMVTVTDVQVSPDLGNARVYVQHALPDDQSRAVLSALQHSASFLRKALVENLHLPRRARVALQRRHYREASAAHRRNSGSDRCGTREHSTRRRRTR